MKKQVAFITGIAGFAGSWLAEELLEHGYRVIGTLLPGESTRNIEHILDKLELSELEITDRDKSIKAVSRIKPDYLFHLAAMASVGQSFSKVQLTLDVNINGTVNLLDAAREYGKLKKFIFVSSPDCYGVFSPKNKLIDEDQPLNPISPYGISKATAEQLSLFFYRQHNLPVTVARAFNHSGPRQSDTFVIPSFASQVASIELGLRPPKMMVGDLSAKRDISDVRDIVRGYRLLAEKGKAGRVYQLSSGKAVKIETILKTLLGCSSKKIKVSTDPSRLRKNDIPVLRGSNRRASQEVGFMTRYSLKTTLRDTFRYWKERLTEAEK